MQDPSSEERERRATAPPRIGWLDFIILTLDAAVDFGVVVWLVPAPLVVQCLLAGALTAAGALAWFRWRDELTGGGW